MDIYFSLLLLFVFDIKNYSKELLQNFLNFFKKWARNKESPIFIKFYIKPDNPWNNKYPKNKITYAYSNHSKLHIVSYLLQWICDSTCKYFLSFLLVFVFSIG